MNAQFSRSAPVPIRLIAVLVCALIMAMPAAGKKVDEPTPQASGATQTSKKAKASASKHKASSTAGKATGTAGKTTGKATSAAGKPARRTGKTPAKAGKTSRRSSKALSPAARRVRAARAHRIKLAFVASTELRPMAQQLATMRTPAAYGGVSAFARQHPGEGAAAAYLALGHAYLLDKRYPDALASLRQARQAGDVLADYAGF